MNSHIPEDQEFGKWQTDLCGLFCLDSYVSSIMKAVLQGEQPDVW